MIVFLSPLILIGGMLCPPLAVAGLGVLVAIGIAVLAWAVWTTLPKPAP